MNGRAHACTSLALAGGLLLPELPLWPNAVLGTAGTFVSGALFKVYFEFKHHREDAMSDDKTTPESWHIEIEHDDWIMAGDDPVAEAWGKTPIEMAANARLIAASKDLLFACELGGDGSDGPELLRNVAHLCDIASWNGSARTLRAKAEAEEAAIRKAHGE
jgi:hypothetical protein